MRARRAATTTAIALMGALLFTGCLPEPAPTTTPSSSASPAPSSTPTSTPTPDPTPTPTVDIALPATCDSLYSPTMRATLDAQTAPLNDPGITLTSSQNAAALEVMNSGIPTIRCTWGVPSEQGMSTNVSIIDATQRDTVIAALGNAGFGCADAAGGTLCTFQQERITLDDTFVKLGESQLFRGNAWISTAWINVFPDGYTEDIAATLWH